MMRLLLIVLVVCAAMPARGDVTSVKQRRVAAVRESAQVRRDRFDLRLIRDKGVDDSPTHGDFDRSIFRESPTPRASSSGAPSSSPPPPSPGIPIATSTYDYQHNQSQGHQIGSVPGHPVVHFCWMGYDIIPLQSDHDSRFVVYSSYTKSGNGGSLNQPFGGVFLSDNDERGGYINLSYTDSNKAQVWFHKHTSNLEPYHSWHYSFPFPGDAGSTWPPNELGGTEPQCDEVLWPHGDAARDAGSDGVPLHVVSHDGNNCPRDLIWYWRYNGFFWDGPSIIDSGFALSYVVCDDPNSDKAAIVVHTTNESQFNDLNNVAYYQSTTGGLGWLSGAEKGPAHKVLVTNYTVSVGPQAWLHLTAAYDGLGALHIVWDEQAIANETGHTAIRHWNSDRNTIRTVALGYWDALFSAGAFNLNLAKITMGIGDGATMCQSSSESNADYVYVLYTQYGGLTQAEQEDASLEGLYNGEQYLAVSTTRGNTWSRPVNLTNTKTPHCNPGPGSPGASGDPPRPDSVCRSEAWGSITKYVRDIDILFISDKDAGGIPQGEGNWQQNPVHYLRFPGGPSNPDALHLCPILAPNFEAMITSESECEYHASQASSNSETLTILNLGNAMLTGSATVTDDFPGAPTLVLQNAGSYSIIGGDPDIELSVTMNSNGASQGLYAGLITVTHNDSTEPSPRMFPIDFFVFNGFFCPQDEVLKTGVASPGSLALEVQSDGRFASQNAMGGLWRHSDSSSSILDGSLLIAHGIQTADTTVYLRFYDRITNGQFGFRALEDFSIDTSNYGTGTGFATATSRMTTKDSVVGITTTWYFPQSYADDEVVIAHYKIYRHNPSVTVNNLAVGVLVDADILPASRLGGIQQGVDNVPGFDSTRNLIWQIGTDTAGHNITGTKTATRFRAGISGRCHFFGGRVGNTSDDLTPGGGPTDGFLYSSMASTVGLDAFTDSFVDLYQLLVLDREQAIDVGDTLHYAVVFASDTISQSSFLAKVDAGIALADALWTCGYPCPCKNDPECDGVVSSVVDVIRIIDIAFRNVPATVDGDCPRERSDVDCSGQTTILDVTRVINVAFRGANPATEYCAPCS